MYTLVFISSECIRALYSPQDLPPPEGFLHFSMFRSQKPGGSRNPSENTTHRGWCLPRGGSFPLGVWNFWNKERNFWTESWQKLTHQKVDPYALVKSYGVFNSTTLNSKTPANNCFYVPFIFEFTAFFLKTFTSTSVVARTPTLRLQSRLEMWSHSWHSWCLEESFLVRNLFYNDTFIDVLFGGWDGDRKSSHCLSNTSTFVPMIVRSVFTVSCPTCNAPLALA